MLHASWNNPAERGENLAAAGEGKKKPTLIAETISLRKINGNGIQDTDGGADFN